MKMEMRMIVNSQGSEAVNSKIFPNKILFVCLNLSRMHLDQLINSVSNASCSRFTYQADDYDAVPHDSFSISIIYIS